MIETRLCFLVLVCCLSVTESLQCFDSSYHRRYGFDEYIFSDATLLSDDHVDNRADCVSKCQWTSLCNQAMYNDITKRCRLHSDSGTSATDGFVDAGWQYYGPSCAIYRLKNSAPATSVLTTNADDVCDADYHALTTCTSTSCHSDGTWMDFAVKCTFTLFTYQQISLNVGAVHSFKLNFDLQPGHVISLQATGSPDQYNELDFIDNSGNYHYHLSLRWHLAHPQCAFNTKNTVWGQEKRGFYFDDHVKNVSDYTIDIHIMDAAFRTYGDGYLLLTNDMGMPFTGVSTVSTKGISAIHKFKVGPDICPY